MLIILTWFFFLGLILGSFANVLVDRGFKRENLWGFSKCDHCQKNLKWFDNIPVLSFFLLSGKCRFCRKKISIQYPIVELAMGLAFLIVAFRILFYPEEFRESVFSFEKSWALFHYLGMVFLFGVIFLWDLKFMIIPDKLVLGGFLLTLIFYLKVFFLREGSCESLSFNDCDFFYNFLGAFLGGGFFGILFWFSDGKWIGGGDVKLGIWLGFLLGIRGVYFWLTISYVLGAIVSIFLLIKKKKKLKSEIPFGPFLLIGAGLVLFFNEEIEILLSRLA